jgi:MscS family membrane protein
MINSITSLSVLGTQDQANWLVAWFSTHSAAMVPVVMTLGVALILHVVAGWMISRTSRRMRAKGFIWSAAIASSSRAPMGAGIWVVAVSMAAISFMEPDATLHEDHIGVMRIAQIRLGLILAIGAWFVTRSLKHIEMQFVERAADSDAIDLTAVRAIGNFAKVSVWLLAVLVAMQSFGVNMTAVITVGGAGGFALSFAFQDVFKNVFGGLMILFCRPFRIDDAVELSGKSIAGSVERIGLYQTVIRGYDSIPITIPNAIFLTTPVLNVSGRKQRRLQMTVGLRYEDMAQIAPVADDIETLLRGDTRLDQEATLRVAMTNFGGSSVDIAITCFAAVDTGIADFTKLQQSLMLQVAEVVASHGADFAFPTQTIELSPTAIAAMKPRS